jgi:bifunctional DNA-binding transcriptional regulator/antitoxin component of YhaV-PrlF toxin-antitoxin module
MKTNEFFSVIGIGRLYKNFRTHVSSVVTKYLDVDIGDTILFIGHDDIVIMKKENTDNMKKYKKFAEFIDKSKISGRKNIYLITIPYNTRKLLEIEKENRVIYIIDANKNVQIRSPYIKI